MAMQDRLSVHMDVSSSKFANSFQTSRMRNARMRRGVETLLSSVLLCSLQRVYRKLTILLELYVQGDLIIIKSIIIIFPWYFTYACHIGFQVNINILLCRFCYRGLLHFNYITITIFVLAVQELLLRFECIYFISNRYVISYYFARFNL